MNKTDLLSTVKTWIELDDQIKTLQKNIRDKRVIKKEATEALVETMRQNDIDCFELGQGNKLIYTKRKSKKPLSKKHLLKALGTYFKGNELQAKEVSKYIMSTREDNIKEDLRRKIPK